MEIKIDQPSLGLLLRDTREASGVSVTKFSQLSGITEDLIQEIESDDLSRISSLPYLKGVLKKYVRFCDLDSAKTEIFLRGLKSSGSKDFLPPNRFSSSSKLRLPIFNPFLLLVIPFLTYFVWQFFILASPPKIILGELPEISSSTTVLVKGRLQGKVKDFYINREKIVLNNGNFAQEVYLSSEVNIIELKAVNFFGQEIVERKMVIVKGE